MSRRLTRKQARTQARKDDSHQLVSERDQTPDDSKRTGTPFFTASLRAGFVSSLPFQTLPDPLNRKTTKLSAQDYALLLQKQQKLRQLNLPVTCHQQERFINRSASHQKSTTSNADWLSRAAAATLIFASEAAGTAICIHESGLLLTCGHCIAETQKEFRTASKKPFWLLTAAGDAVQAKCVAWDDKRDLTLLQIIGIQQGEEVGRLAVGKDAKGMTAISIITVMPGKNAPVVCIGHPGSEDFEAEQEGVQTGYPVLTISEGRFRGYASSQNIENNSEIGALMHDAWTYWGHSGAPLIYAGQLIGLHSSWDNKTGMRRGVGVEAIQNFLEENIEK